jgi:hypothetical protein
VSGDVNCAGACGPCGRSCMKTRPALILAEYAVGRGAAMIELDDTGERVLLWMTVLFLGFGLFAFFLVDFFD